MRRTLGRSARQLAELIDVRHETISRWENGAAPVDRAAWLVLGDIVFDTIGQHVPMLERASRISSGKKPSASTAIVAERKRAPGRRPTQHVRKARKATASR